MSFRLITPPTEKPVSLDEAKAQCRLELDETDQDTILDGYIDAAVDQVEAITGRPLMTQTWELLLDDFSDTIRISKGPVQSIESITYYDEDEVLQTLDPSEYVLDNVSDPAWIVRPTDVTWPNVACGVNNVIIQFVAGYTVVPPRVKQAILLMIADWFKNREDSTAAQLQLIPHRVRSLLANVKTFF